MSTLLHLDSCDHYDSATSESKWLSAVTIVEGGRTGKCLQGLGEKAFDIESTVTAGCAINLPSSIAATLLQFENASNGASVTLTCLSDSTLQIVVACGNVTSTRPVSAVTTIGVGRWFYCELQVTHTCTRLDDNNFTDGFSYTVRINEEVVLSGSHTLDVPWYARPDYQSGFKVCQFLSTSANLADDIYITDDEFLGDIGIVVIRPNADTATVQWGVSSSPAGDHYSEVDDVNPDGDTSYIHTTTDGAIDLVELEDIGDVGDIVGVQLNAVAEKAEVGTATFSHYFNVSATNVEDSEVNYPPYLTWIDFRLPMRKNPVSSPLADFTADEVNAMQQGVKRLS